MSIPHAPAGLLARFRLHRSPVRRAALAASAGLLLLTAGCADFSSEAATFTLQPTLTAQAVVPQTPGEASPSTSVPPSGSQSPDPSASESPPPDPCAPTDPAVIATCLSAPWGLAPLPDGESALVGERTTGRILQVAKGTQPAPVAQIDGIDATGDGGLLGIALSPSYDEDGLIYAYVTTATDNRIVRVARGDTPKAVFTGIPKGTEHNGGRIAFGADRLLYVGTGDTGAPVTDPASLAGKVLRLDEFGKPAEGNPVPGSAVSPPVSPRSAGCARWTTAGWRPSINVPTQDLLLPLQAGTDYTTAADGEALWTWTAADGGAADCSITAGLLGSTSLDLQQLTVIPTGAGGTFTGSPTVLLDSRYGRLLTVTGDANGLFWLTTSNKDGKGTPVPSDDRVVVIPAGSAGGEGGPD